MHWRVEVSRQAQEQLFKLPRNVRTRLERAIDEFEQKDDSQWSNVKTLRGPEWKGRFRKRVGDYRIIYRKFPERAAVEISSVIIRSKDTYRQT